MAGRTARALGGGAPAGGSPRFPRRAGGAARPVQRRAAGRVVQPGWVGLLRAHLHAARAATAHVHTRPRRLIHGDFTPWNLRVQHGQWTGLLDLEFTRPADPLADFALAWRGAHDDVIHGYAEVSHLSDGDRALIPALWWAHLLSGALHDLRAGTRDDGWTARMLARRSPLMGELSAVLPGSVLYSGAL
nr:phosphotransferase [Deinococcus xianganensis]